MSRLKQPNQGLRSPDSPDKTSHSADYKVVANPVEVFCRSQSTEGRLELPGNVLAGDNCGNF